MKVKVTFLFILSFFALSGQDFEVLYGINYFYSTPEEKNNALLRTHFNNDSPTLKVRFALDIPQVEKLHLVTSYQTFRPFVSVRIGTDEEINSRMEGESIFINGGSSKTRVHRMGIGIGYKYLARNLFEITPRVILNNEVSIDTWAPGPGDSGTLGRYDYAFFTYSNPGLQVLPEFNLNTAFKIYKGFLFTVDYSFLKGFRPHMSTDVSYSIDGELQEKATFHTRGTSHQIKLGLKLRLWK